MGLYEWLEGCTQSGAQDLRQQVRLERLVGRLLCWWFGCKQHEDDPAPPEYAHCVRCDGIVPYGDMVGATKHNKMKEWCHWYLYRKWWPEKCEHGKRWRCNEEHLPF